MSHRTIAHRFNLQSTQPHSNQRHYVAGSQPNAAYGNSPVIHHLTVVQAAPSANYGGFPLQVVHGAPQHVMQVVLGRRR